MNEEQEQVWDRLKYGMPGVITTVVIFHGNGTATKFNSGWISGSRFSKITVDDVAQSPYRDYEIHVNDLIFEKPPAHGAKIAVEIYIE